METTLYNLISALEYGTKLHISVVFFGHYGNEQTRLPHAHRIHPSPVCMAAKETPEGFSSCYRCRSTVLRLAQRRKHSFGGLCAKGVYEYCRPIIRGNAAAAVLFIGNILPSSAAAQAALSAQFGADLSNTLQSDCSPDDCRHLADVLERHIHYLLDTYGEQDKGTFDPLIENARNYIEGNYLYDFTTKKLADAFSYNEKYFGRLFKERVGMSVREYCNHLKVEQAKPLLADRSLSVSQICTRCGFNNVTYFNRVFKALTGMTPGQFRDTT